MLRCGRFLYSPTLKLLLYTVIIGWIIHNLLFQILSLKHTGLGKNSTSTCISTILSLKYIGYRVEIHNLYSRSLSLKYIGYRVEIHNLCSRLSLKYTGYRVEIHNLYSRHCPSNIWVIVAVFHWLFMGSRLSLKYIGYSRGNTQLLYVPPIAVDVVTLII